MADDPLSRDEQLEIACRMLDREERGLTRLLEVYGPRVKWLLREKLRGALSSEDVDTCLRIAAVKAWNSAYDDSKGTLGGWFYSIAFHAAVDMAREGKSGRVRTVPLEVEPGLDGRIPACIAEDDEPDPAIEDLMKSVKLLGPKQREIVEADLLAGGEADSEALAMRLGIPKQHVYSYREKSRKALLARMEKMGHTAESTARRRR